MGPHRFISILSLALLALAFTSRPLTAEPPPFFPMPKDNILEPGGRPILAGIAGGIDYNIHRGEFYLSEDGIVCCRFEEGSGIGPVAGARAFIPLSDEIDLSPRLQYEGRGGEFRSISDPLPFFGSNNEVEMVRFEDRLETTIGTIGVDVLASYRVTEFGLYVAAGPSAGFVVTKSFIKSESIAEPSGVKYLDGSTAKETFRGELDIVNPVLLSIRGGIGATLEVADGIHINPEILYGLPLNRISKEDNWKAGTVQATLGILIAL